MRRIIVAILVVLAASVLADETIEKLSWTDINFLLPIGFDQIIGTCYRDDSIFIYHYKVVKKYHGEAWIVITSTKGGVVTKDTMDAPVDTGFVTNPLVQWPIEPPE